MDDAQKYRNIEWGESISKNKLCAKIFKGRRKYLNIEHYQAFGIKEPYKKWVIDSRKLMIAWSGLILAGYLSESILFMWCIPFLMIGWLCVPFIVLKSFETQKKTKSEKLNHLLYRLIYRQGLLIQSGYSLRKSLQHALEKDVLSIRNYPIWAETLNLLAQGAVFETTLIKLSKNSYHELSDQLAQLWLQGEKRSEDEVLLMMHQWLERFREKDKDVIAGKISSNSLWIIFPSMINFSVLVIILISPIFFGGLKT